MSRSSEPVLAWLRTMSEKRGLNTAALAGKCGLQRGRVRKILTGEEEMTLEELLKLTTALEISPGDLGLPGSALLKETADEPSSALGVVEPEADQGGAGEGGKEAVPSVDAWGNHPEQLVRIGFALGCDFMMVATTSELADSGLPAQVIEQYRDGAVPIRLDAAYHKYNQPRYDERGVTMTLSFDALYECTFPWTSLRQVLFFPAPPRAVEPPAPKKPSLRLVE